MRTLIVGGGLAGLTTAWALLEKGEDVVVLEAREAVALETSFANAGMLTPSMPEPWNGPGVARDLFAALFDPHASMKLRLRAMPSLFAWGVRFLRNSRRPKFLAATADNFHLCRYSMQKTLQLMRTLEIEFDFSAGGTLCIARRLSDMPDRRDVCTHLVAHGLNVKEVNVDEIIEIEPTLAPIAAELVGGFWFPDDARGDAHMFCNGIAKALVARGVEIRTNTIAKKVVVRHGGVSGVETLTGLLPADRVVVAAGVRSPSLLRTVGQTLPVKPAKGYSVTVDAEGLGPLPAVSVLDNSLHSVVNTYGQRLRVVGIAEFTGFDTSLSPPRVEKVCADLKALFPEIFARIDLQTIRPWAGLRPMSSDGRPFIGSGGVDGLFVNSGHGALGWTMAAGSAQLLADQIFNDDTEIDPAPFRVDR